MLDLYILDGKQVVKCEDMEEWAIFMADSDKRTIAITQVGETLVSTIFLGLDHNFGLSFGPPMIFETMVFGGEFDSDCERCSTREIAEKQHKGWVYKVREFSKEESL